MTLVTDPPGAEVHLYRFVTRYRRLVPELVRSLGRTPLVEVPLEMGSYLLEIRNEGHDVVRYPVFIERRHHWDGIRPGGREPHPIALPQRGTLNSNACYIPAGWFWAGGDAGAYDGWPRRRYWADAFVMQRFPVTNREYIEFLDDMVAQGHEAEALRHVPRERTGKPGELCPMIYGRDEHGRFKLRPDVDGDVWLANWPVIMVDWHDAKVYADWQAARDGSPWRLASELEYEKAARGVDQRIFPWGDYLDPSWCCMSDSHPHEPLPSDIDHYPVDVSVYGVRGLAGNTRDWCEDIYRSEAPDNPIVQSIALDMPGSTVDAHRVYRGGSWSSATVVCRSATRYWGRPAALSHNIGIRLSRSYH